jgi:ankyrin repeat protein
MIDIVNLDVQQEKDGLYRSSLALAVKYNLKDIARSILRLGGNADERADTRYGSRTSSGYKATPLETAAGYGHEAMVHLLLDAGASQSS